MDVLVCFAIAASCLLWVRRLNRRDLAERAAALLRGPALICPSCGSVYCQPLPSGGTARSALLRCSCGRYYEYDGEVARLVGRLQL